MLGPHKEVAACARRSCPPSPWPPRCAAAPPAMANVPLTQVSADPFTNSTSQHATEVEPDTFANGATVVGAFQVGRFFNGGATDVGFVRSGDGGAHWDAPGFLPGHDVQLGRGRQPVRARQRRERRVRRRARDVADLVDPAAAEHVGARRCSSTARPTTARTWSTPVADPAAGLAQRRPRQELDRLRQRRELAVPRPLLHGARQLRRGRPRADEHVDRRRRDVERADRDRRPRQGPRRPAGRAARRHRGRPVREPQRQDRRVRLRATAAPRGRSAVSVSAIRFHGVAGGLRTSPLPTAEIAADGTVYVAWEDCRFRAACAPTTSCSRSRPTA